MSGQWKDDTILALLKQVSTLVDVRRLVKMEMK